MIAQDELLGHPPLPARQQTDPALGVDGPLRRGFALRRHHVGRLAAFRCTNRCLDRARRVGLWPTRTAYSETTPTASSGEVAQAAPKAPEIRRPPTGMPPSRH